MDDPITVVEKLASRHAPPGACPGVDPETTLQDYGISSLAMVSLIADIEHEFGVRFPAAMMSHQVFRTFGTVAAAVQALRAGDPAAVGEAVVPARGAEPGQ